MPNPLYDPVCAICFAVEAQEGPDKKLVQKGVLIDFNEQQDATAIDSIVNGCVCIGSNVTVRVASDESHLFQLLEELVAEWDPDFLVGFEVQKASIGYLIDRAAQMDVRNDVV